MARLDAAGKVDAFKKLIEDQEAELRNLHTSLEALNQRYQAEKAGIATKIAVAEALIKGYQEGMQISGGQMPSCKQAADAHKEDLEEIPTTTRLPRGQLKSIVLELLEEAGNRGLNAHGAVAAAKKNGLTIERASVSSQLSRLKSDGVADYDGEAYRLKKFVVTSSPQDREQEARERNDNLLFHPNSRVAP